MSVESLSENCASFETKTKNYKMDFSFVSEHWKFWEQKPNSATFERGGGGGRFHTKTNRRFIPK